MPTPEPPYAAAFHQQMVELVRAGRGITDLAQEFGCNASSIHAWVEAAGGLDGSSATSSDAPLSMVERLELIELRRKFKQAQQERGIFAKATAWFVGRSKLAGSEKTSMSSRCCRPADPERIRAARGSSAVWQVSSASQRGRHDSAPCEHGTQGRPRMLQHCAAVRAGSSMAID